MDLKRMWVNQPSALQPDHALHGECVLVNADEAKVNTVVEAWFVHSAVVSQQVFRTSLSSGWPMHLRLSQK